MLLKVSMGVLLSAIMFSFLATFNNEELRTYWSKNIISPFLDRTYLHLYGRKFVNKSPSKGPVNWPACWQQPHQNQDLHKYKNVVILGHVFDVSSSPEIYGEGAPYSKLTGRDASRAFVTGDLSEEGLTDSLEGLSNAAFGELIQVLTDFGDRYPCLGYHYGQLFDHFAVATPRFNEIKKTGESLARQHREAMIAFPKCSVSTSRYENNLYCEQITSDSEILRPRLFFEISRQTPRCACVHPSLLNDPRLQLYPNCHREDFVCTLSLKDMRNLHKKVMHNK